MNSFPPFSKKILIAAAFATFALLSGTNISARNNDNIRPDRKTLYKKGFYSSTLLTGPPERGNDAKWMEEGYKVLSLIRLDIPNPEGVIDEYREKFKESPLIPQMLFECAIAHFDREEYSEAAKLFSSIPVKDLYKGQRDEFYFRKGYCQMRMGNNGEAGSDFAEITKKGSSPYLFPALYYSGYINYINRDFDKAIPLFKRAMKDERYRLYSSYHILESEFLLKNYDYVIENGHAVYDEIDAAYKYKVARIISEAYFGLDRPDQAKYYFELYSLNGGRMSESDIFYSGMISYTLKNYEGATDSFSQIASSADSLGQNAAYHLGQSYIQLKNKHNALEAFKIASECSFDKEIQEDAMFNYAKLCFDLSRDIKPFEEYLSRYSSTGRWDEVHSYMATSFLINGNYNEAIGVLNKIRNKSRNDMANLQKARFFRGLELINSGSYTAAIPFLESSSENGYYNTELKNLSNYWLAESLYRKDDYAASLSVLNGLQKSARFRQTPEYYTSFYNMGYNYFKMGQYDKAAEYFTKYINFPGKMRYFLEAETRLADSYFMLKNYDAASQLYERIAVEEEYSDLYPAIQGAIAYGLLSEYEKKCALLEEVTKPEHSASPLYSQALYELGRTLVQNVEDERAEPVFGKLINDPKDSSYYYKSLLEMGMINANRQKYDAALGYYKTIVEKNPLSDEGQSALSGIESIYQSLNKPEEFLAYLESVGLSSVKSADEKESMLFNSAEQIYLGGNCSRALEALLSYLRKYPEGVKKANACFYIADCYDKSGKTEKAAEYYFKVMETGDESFSELATLNYAALSYKLQKYSDAAAAYETLEKIARLDNNRIEAMIGKIKSYYMCKEYEKCLYQAAEFKNITNLEKEKRELANYYSAKSYLALSEREKAVPLLKEVALDPGSDYGSEASYLLVLDAYDAGNFEDVENLTFEMSESGTVSQYWLAKTFITLGDSYVERDNIAQAKATFESILDNYVPNGNDDIKSIVKMRLAKLEELEKMQ